MMRRWCRCGGVLRRVVPGTAGPGAVREALLLVSLCLTLTGYLYYSTAAGTATVMLQLRTTGPAAADNHTADNHTADNHIADNHIADNHIADNYTTSNHSADNQTTASDTLETNSIQGRENSERGATRKPATSEVLDIAVLPNMKMTNGSRRDVVHPEISWDHLRARIQTVESRVGAVQRRRDQLVVVRGQIEVIRRDVAAYRQALLKHDLKVGVQQNYTTLPQEEEASPIDGSTGHDVNHNITMLLCLSFADGLDTCYTEREIANINGGSYKNKVLVNRLDGLRSALWRKDGLCETLASASPLPVTCYYGKLCRHRNTSSHSILPKCHNITKKYSKHNNTSVRYIFGDSSTFIIKSISKKHPPFLASATFLAEEFSSLWNTSDVLVQDYIPDQLLVSDLMFTLRCFLLVRHLQPLSLYLYTEGLVSFRRHNPDDNQVKKMLDREWLYSDLLKYMEYNHGVESVRVLQHNVNVTIHHTFDAYNYLHNERKRCSMCYQMMSIDLIFDSHLKPYVTEVNGQPSLQSASGQYSWLYAALLDEMLALLLPYRINSTTSSAEVGNYIINMVAKNEVPHVNAFDYRYNVSDADGLSNLVQDVKTWIVSKSTNYKHIPTTGIFEDQQQQLKKLQHLYSYDINVAVSARWQHTNISGQHSHAKCSTDDLVLPYISSVLTWPSVEWSPPVSPLHSTYESHVSYDKLSVRLHVRPAHCHVNVKLDTVYGISGKMFNSTLGLGANRLVLVLVPPGSPQYPVNTYTLTIHRHARRQQVPALDMQHVPYPQDSMQTPHNSMTSPHNSTPSLKHPTRAHNLTVCAYKQSCSLPVFADEPCGPQPTESHYPFLPPAVRGSWSRTMTYLADHLDPCTPGVPAPGVWLLPCAVERCGGSGSGAEATRHCDWSRARWQPYTCNLRDPPLTRTDINTCLDGKKLLFVGDSTLRGMMYYLLQRSDGWLSAWYRSHHIKVFPEVNRNRTQAMFAYYPQFWMPDTERPALHTQLLALIRRSGGLQNNHNTVLVVGGVHWLQTQHLYMIKRLLHKQKLSNIQVIVKTLSSGFHQPVAGMRSLTLSDQQTLARRNQDIVNHARAGFDLLDTFNVTAARYGDFYPGHCACHFHQVVEHKIPVDVVSAPRDRRDTWFGKRFATKYEVVGEINALYTNMLIDTICRHRPDPAAVN